MTPLYSKNLIEAASAFLVSKGKWCEGGTNSDPSREELPPIQKRAIRKGSRRNLIQAILGRECSTLKKSREITLGGS